ncbi:MAG: hypothetical protein WCZ99_00105 [Candidatus Paceibacterota bacterium]
MKNNYWKHKTAEIEKGANIGKGTKIWHHCQIKKGAVIGNDCTVGHNCFIAEGAVIGNNVKIQSNTDIWDKVVLQDYVFVGPSAVFTNDKNPRSKYPKGRQMDSNFGERGGYNRGKCHNCLRCCCWQMGNGRSRGGYKERCD